MAAIDFPSTLPRAQVQQGFSRDRSYGFFDVQPAAGPPYIMRTSRDRPEVYNLVFVYGYGEAETFINFVEQTLEGGRLPFNLVVESEDGFITVEAEFTQTGYPQLSSVRGRVHTYSAQVRAKRLDFTPLELFYSGEDGMWVVTTI